MLYYPPSMQPAYGYAPPAPRPVAPPPRQPQAVRPPARPAPVVRAQNSDEPRIERRPLPPMPTPEQLGVSMPKPVTMIDLRVRLDRVGASGFQLASQADGWRFACRLPNGRTVEAIGASDTDAVLRALMQVEPR